MSARDRNNIVFNYYNINAYILLQLVAITDALKIMVFGKLGI